jgi:hypothetical protein
LKISPVIQPEEFPENVKFWNTWIGKVGTENNGRIANGIMNNLLMTHKRATFWNVSSRLKMKSGGFGAPPRVVNTGERIHPFCLRQ